MTFHSHECGIRTQACLPAALAVLLLLGPVQHLAAQPLQDSAAVTYGEPEVSRWKIGYIITAQGGPLTGATAYATVPMDWPEQQVKIVEEDVSPTVRSIRYRTLEDGARQMIVTIPRLAAGESARAIITFEVRKRPIEAPSDPAHLRIPARPGAELRRFLAPSPQIESRDREIVALAEKIGAGHEDAWSEVGALFDWVRGNITYQFDEELRGAKAALDARQGDCEELTSLFIALCRARNIPARSVWIPGHCYPEFYLEDDQGRGHWLPCQAAGEARDFGRMVEPRPILQKGDQFKVPGERKVQRYVHEKFEAKDAAASPRVEFVREVVSGE